MNLDELLAKYSRSVDRRKLALLRTRLEAALSKPLADVVMRDPVELTNTLSQSMRRLGATAGTIHSLSQFFMGLVRRAAVDGLIPAPPEGPWTQDWQRMISNANPGQHVKLALRSLAAWASSQGIGPTAVRESEIRQWARTVGMKDPMLHDLFRFISDLNAADLTSNSNLLERLQRKAKQGTVKDEMHLW